MNRVQIPLLKRVPSSQLVDGTCELPGPTVNVTMFPASSRSRKRSGGLKAKPQPGCWSAAAHPKHLVVLRPDRQVVDPGRSGMSDPRLKPAECLDLRQVPQIALRQIGAPAL